MNRTTVSFALTGCIAICSCALAQGPVPIPIPEGVPTVGLEEFLERVAASTGTEFLIDIDHARTSTLAAHRPRM